MFRSTPLDFRTLFASWTCAGALLVLWASAATAQTVKPVLDINTGSQVMYPSYITQYNGLLYFRGTAVGGGADAELWRSDGHTAQRVADILPGPNGSSPTSLAVYNNKLYFGASGPTGAPKLWQYDPISGVSLAPGSSSQASNPDEMIAYNGNLYYRAFRSNIGIELWKFDGTTQTPMEMFPGAGSSYPQHFIQYNGLLYFNANGTANQGTELWRFNGAGMPTEAARIYPNNGSSPEEFALFQNQLYFSAYDGVHGYELWSFDGAQAKLIADLNPTPNPGNGDTFLMDSSPSELTVFNDILYFAADDGTHGRELWSYDGDTLKMVLDINPGPYGSYLSEFTIYDGKLYFSADNGYIAGLNNLQPTVWMLAVPEPSTLSLLCLAALTALRRRQCPQ